MSQFCIGYQHLTLTTQRQAKAWWPEGVTSRATQLSAAAPDDLAHIFLCAQSLGFSDVSISPDGPDKNFLPHYGGQNRPNFSKLSREIRDSGVYDQNVWRSEGVGQQVINLAAFNYALLTDLVRDLEAEIEAPTRPLKLIQDEDESRISMSSLEDMALWSVSTTFNRFENRMFVAAPTADLAANLYALAVCEQGLPIDLSGCDDQSAIYVIGAGRIRGGASVIPWDDPVVSEFQVPAVLGTVREDSLPAQHFPVHHLPKLARWLHDANELAGLHAS